MKDLLLQQTAGAGNSIQNQVDLAIDIYCELNSKDKYDFRATLWKLQDCMGFPPTDLDDWRMYQKRYSRLIDAHWGVKGE